jgi:hypothetical protein
MSTQPPWMGQSEEAAAQLRVEGPWGDGIWPDVNPDDIPYGTSAEDLFDKYWPLGDFLEAAALA